MRRPYRTAWAALALLWLFQPGRQSLFADDWPMWRHDASRGGASEETLPETLHLEWILQLPAPRPAWPPSQEKLQYDTHYEPVLAGKTLFVPSMVRDKVTAHDTNTGEERWRFYADAPVRFAPVHWKEKLYFAADDGYLYCLDATRGSLIWKFRGGPSDRKVIGNNRVVSTWPARGAPVIFDGKIYFGASIWPFMGIFIHALNAESGEVIWTNSGSGSSYIVQQHNSSAFAGVAPQGYLAATEKWLVVSGGRTMPAIFDRRTGEFLHFDVSSRAMGNKGGGGYSVMVGKDIYVNRGTMYRFDTGRFVTNVGAAILTDHALIGLRTRLGQQSLRGYRPSWREVEFKDRKGKTQKRTVAPASWSATLEEPVERLFIKSGPRLYCSAPEGGVLAVDLPRLDRGARVSWKTRIPDEPLGMLSGDGKLFVTTDRGRIYCFGGQPSDVEIPTAETGTLVSRGSGWRFFDAGGDLGADWREADFDDSTWPAGKAQLGYGDDDETTRLSFGDDPKKKPVVCYFRHAFEVDEECAYSELTLGTLVDDGAVVYLNGKEVARHFMPGGEIRHDTLAKSGSDEKTYQAAKVPDELLKPGRNVLAVQVHQIRRDSSDLSFDLELTGKLTMKEHRLVSQGDRWTERVGQILAAKDYREPRQARGYCLVLGLGDGRLVEELARQTGLHVIVVDADERKIDAFRRRMDALGAYGTRIAALAGDPRSLELPPYLAELLISEEPLSVGFGEGEPFVRRIFSVLRPYSGVALLACSEPGYRVFAAAVERAGLDKGSLERSEGFALLRRHDAPTGSGEWTHQYADSANTVVSKDRVVKAPLGLLWFGGPPNDPVLPRHGHGPTPQVAGGRLFIEGRNMIRSVDIYTGRLLWERDLKDVGKFYDYTSHEPGANAIGSNYVSLADSVYVVDGRTCLRLDPASGETIAEFRLPVAVGEEKPPDWGYIGVWKNYLLAGARPRDYTSPLFTRGEISGIKDELLKKSLESFQSLKDFKPVERQKREDDRSYLRAILNRLLAEDDLPARVPEEVRKKAKAADVESELKDYMAELPGRKATSRAALVIKRRLLNLYYKLPKFAAKPAGKSGSQLRIGSKQLVAMDRISGEVLWQFDGDHQIRHNAIAIGGGVVFSIDRMPDVEASFQRRRGRKVEELARLVALDVRTGKTIWETTERVFGTWLGHSGKHDTLIQAGSRWRDRARDEVRRGMVAYRGSTGEVLWEHDLEYSGPCLLLEDRIITQGGSQPGFAFDIRTGRRVMRPHPVSGEPVAWGYTRNYGCSHTIGSPNLLMLRSAAAGYYDLKGDSGTGNLGGFRAGCTPNLIPAGGVLSAPDYTRTCTCAYQNQASLAMVHMPEMEMWTFLHLENDFKAVRRVGLNFGAPGDRRGPDGTLWLDYPSVGGKSPDLPVQFTPAAEGANGGGDEQGDETRYLRYHASKIDSRELAWVAASCLEACGEISIRLLSPGRVDILNEVPDGNPITASNAAVKARVPADVVPQSGTRNRTSLGARSGEGEFRATVKGYEKLASSNLTVEFWTRSDRDIDYVDARGSDKKKKKKSQGFVIDNRALRVRYFVASEDGKKGEAEIRLESEEKIPDDRWIHVAFTYDAPSGQGKLYRDGKLIGSHDGPDDRPLWWDTKVPELIIAQGSGPNSLLDELRISNDALDPSQFLLSRELPADPDAVIGYWRMESPKSSSDPNRGRVYTVRLVFAEIDGLGAGQRDFDVAIQGKTVLRDFDVAREAGGADRVVLKEFEDVFVRDHLRIRLTAKAGRNPILSGVQVIAESGSF